MNDSQIFQLIGLAYAAMGLGGVLNKDLYKRLMEDFAGSPALLFVTGILALVTGFVIVTFRNVWVMGWPVLITVIGWISLVKGIWIFLFPGFYTHLNNKMKTSVRLMRVYAGIVLVIGVFFLLLGFGVL
jgi:hypothetical protein